MFELFSAAINPVALPLTVAMGGVVAYWITVILGFMDVDMFDMDIELEAGDAGFLSGLLRFGDTPVTVVLSLITFAAWNIMVIVVHYLPVEGLLAWAMYLPVLFVAYSFARLIARPIGRVFASTRKTHAALESAEAQLCTLIGDTNDSRISQGRIETDGPPILVRVKARPGKFHPRGSEVLIIEEDESGKFYYVEEMDELEQ